MEGTFFLEGLGTHTSLLDRGGVPIWLVSPAGGTAGGQGPQAVAAGPEVPKPTATSQAGSRSQGQSGQEGPVALGAGAGLGGARGGRVSVRSMYDRWHSLVSAQRLPSGASGLSCELGRPHTGEPGAVGRGVWDHSPLSLPEPLLQRSESVWVGKKAAETPVWMKCAQGGRGKDGGEGPMGLEYGGLETTLLGSWATSMPSLTTSLPREGKSFCPHVLGPRQASPSLDVCFPFSWGSWCSEQAHREMIGDWLPCRQGPVPAISHAGLTLTLTRDSHTRPRRPGLLLAVRGSEPGPGFLGTGLSTHETGLWRLFKLRF